ncbi:type I-F CRISPR-associated protein Csy2 [Photobacterium sp. SDRW27]|uniref:type I-F CRISPR-associated protein Csy2 n=1 Tax=Photobacterium obscurum TaxID=2829490 RepID=UPI002243182B|nr:type I-F CRISPR-associated protein Csy2 [Photobacterium obscurum]MCW8332095.1 type I-F CRISPR-associated protein Csy2 [Photobacterium obscurum]
MSATLTEAIEQFIRQRYYTKQEALDKEYKKARATAVSADSANQLDVKFAARKDKLKDAFVVANWLDGAAQRACQISMATHAVKFTHSSAKGTNILATDLGQDHRYLDTASLASPAVDAVGNAAALDVARLLQLTDDSDQSLLDYLQCDNVTPLADFAASPAQLDNWLGGLKQALHDTRPSSHTLSKQVYFPVGDGQYHLLAPLYSSSLSQAIHQEINYSRYSKEMAEAREARRKQLPHDHPVVAYPDLAMTIAGGSKPQNVSQLNASRGGRNYLLSAQPPMWQPQPAAPGISDNIADHADQYLVLKHIRIGNANAIAGFTYGFPVVTHFLGYVHALSRKLQHSLGIRLDDVGIVCHQHQVHAYRESNFAPYTFALTRNPLTKDGKTAPINEEGRMHLTVSLVIKAHGINTVSEQVTSEQCLAIKTLAEQHKLAGGQVLSIDDCYLASTDCHNTVLSPLLPGYVLVDRSGLLAEKAGCNTSRLENWLDFSALKFEATDEPAGKNTDKVKWQQVASPKGYLVPVQVGYKQIAPTYGAGKVANVRDRATPVSFVEAVHSIGEWLGSPSRLASLQEMLWQYHFQPPFYVCRPLQPEAGETDKHAAQLDPDC